MTRAPETVRTERLWGRRVTPDDLAYVIEIDRDALVQRTLFGAVQSEAQSRTRLQRWIEMWEQDGFGFWLFGAGDGTAVGHAGLFRSPREPGEVEVGYVLKPAHWGRGYATEMTRLALHVGFDVLGLHRIIAIAQASNSASRRVMEKCGMTYEATTPSADGIPAVRYGIARAAVHAG